MFANDKVDMCALRVKVSENIRGADMGSLYFAKTTQTFEQTEKLSTAQKKVKVYTTTTLISNNTINRQDKMYETAKKRKATCRCIENTGKYREPDANFYFCACNTTLLFQDQT